MPLMAHKDNGFHQATSGEVDTLKAAGWELCSDPIEYKRRVWGIDLQNESVVEVPESGDEAPKRRGRPRKEQ